MKIILDYIWLDGEKISNIRHITKVHDFDIRRHDGINSLFGKIPRLLDPYHDKDILPKVKFNNKLTNQDGEDVYLLPVSLFKNPIIDDSFFVMCEVYDGKNPHKTNSRNSLSVIMESLSKENNKYKFNQNVCIYKNGEDKATYREFLEQYRDTIYLSDTKSIGEDLINEILLLSLKIGIPLETISNNIFGIKYWLLELSNDNPLLLADSVIILRHLMNRISPKYDLSVETDNKYFMDVKSDKDKIIDPYLLIRKMIRSSD